MRSSFIAASLFATLALAKPMHQKLHKKAIVYDIVTDVVYVTVTADSRAKKVQVETVYINVPTTTKSTTKKSTTKSKSSTTTTTKSTTTTTTTPSPIPTTTAYIPPPPPAPVTTTTEEPVYTPEPTPDPIPTPPKPVDPPSSGNAIRDAALAYHNKMRALHHAPPLRWNEAAARHAQGLADQCLMKHETAGMYGQNIAASSGLDPSNMFDFVTSRCADWYNEINHFGPYWGQSNVNDENVLHFTQVVWKDTLELGCGASTNCPGMNYVFCDYVTPGNFGGQFAENVLPM